MKRFIIKYKHDPASGSAEQWHERVGEFIAAVDNDPELKGRLTYRCLRVAGTSDYFHLVEAASDDIPKILNQREWFKPYTEELRRISAGDMQVLTVETILETKG